jgi:hypothetical protein
MQYRNYPIKEEDKTNSVCVICSLSDLGEPAYAENTKTLKNKLTASMHLDNLFL